MSQDTFNLFYTELQTGEGGRSLVEGRWIDALAAGDFTDMWGVHVEVDASDLGTYVEKTRRGIDATKDSEGDPVGLPIDARDHARGEAAGWIVDVRLSPENSEIIQVLPKWTDVGVELIQSNRMRYFSATFTTRNKAILGGTLTNWPATRDQDDNILLSPVELSERMRVIDFDKPGFFSSIKDFIYNVIDDVTRDTESDHVKQTNYDELEGEMTIELTEEQLDERISGAVESAISPIVELLGNIGQGGNGDEPAGDGEEVDSINDVPDFVNMLQIDSLSGEARERLEDQLSQYFETIQAEAEQSFLARMARSNRRREMMQLATQLTAGSEEQPRGLPVDAQTLADHLFQLSGDQVAFWRDLLKSVVDKGLVEFTELGNNDQDNDVKRDLPQEYVSLLDSGEIEVSDLESSIVAPDLGDLDQYDLSKWEGK